MSNLESSTLIAAAIGVTVGVISVAGMFLYQQFIEKRQYKVRNHNLELVNQRIAELQEELEALRQQQKRKKRSAAANRKHTLNSNDSTYVSTENDVDTFSTAGTDIADDEFFDCSDTEDATGDIELRESETIKLLEVELMKIRAQEKTEEQIEEDVYYKLQELTKLHPNNVDIIWRFANACYTYINHFSNIEHKKKIISEGLEACEQIINVENADLHKWYAILIGLHGEYLPLAERIKNGSVFKNHVMTALKLRPKDSDLHHLLGRFRYEISNLTWIERKVATTFFSEPPNASYEEAIESFEQAEEFATEPHLENRLFLSKSYIAISNYEKAIYWLNEICQQTVVTKQDQNVQSEAKKLLQEYSSYL
ncbi:regulator of microtubule dynamics protein 1-like [Vespa velutina]|uniref:regulator of microtubule dynamics protein 1-like n=1 Tax=Vespa velutina TaxID=202808 RepID=UPI001FB44553|nr:regulator of microtubule dynamics protein 1-like [Vespa velutina]XP_047352731.1 regulator of microtubule dynamics protein 1-like [Vespa velutina]XP_047352732.1 regulator of microtubule dynamics protein 1-like [Vespa velutina]XP_047352733.1 regulator of microtubule dynamics protein 1-like [Vespa velutina]